MAALVPLTAAPLTELFDDDQPYATLFSLSVEKDPKKANRTC